MRNAILCTLVFIIFVILPIRSFATQAKGIEVVIKDDAGHEVGLYKSSYALLIGVSDYTSGWPKLHSVPIEIYQVEETLKKMGFHVVKIMNPTSETLTEAFEDFIDLYGFDQNNRLLFFFSGHGHTRKYNQKGYLVPTDAPSPNKDKVGFLRKALPMNQILAWSRQLEAKHALFLFDSCFSGTVFKARDLPQSPPHISRATALPVRQYISAGDAGEEVPAKSVFTPAFIDALDYGWGDLNKDGYVSGTELGLYLQEKVPQHSDQNPQYGKIRDYQLSRGDFIFALKGSISPKKKRPVEVHEQYKDKTIASQQMEQKPEREMEVPPRTEHQEKQYDTAKLTPHSKQAQAFTDTTHKVIDRDERFIAYANGTVLDTKTGLEWIAGPEEWWLTFEDAKSWVEKLAVDGGGWQMPTLSQVESLYVQGSGSHNVTPFLKISESYVWCTKNGDPAVPKQFYFGLSSYWSPRNYSSNIQALAVRTEGENAKEFSNKPSEFSSPKPAKETMRGGRFIAYDNGTVLDTKTNLMWAAKDSGKGIMERHVADYLGNYSVGDHNDWRLPTMEELESLYDSGTKNKNGYHVTKLIDISAEWVWGDAEFGNLWLFDFFQGGRAVRAGREKGFWSYESPSRVAHVLPVREPNN